MLEIIVERLGIEMKEVMVIGDNLNDLLMLEKVGYLVVMENGVEEVKKIVKYVIDMNENSGVGKVIMKLLCE